MQIQLQLFVKLVNYHDYFMWHIIILYTTILHYISVEITNCDRNKIKKDNYVQDSRKQFRQTRLFIF